MAGSGWIKLHRQFLKWEWWDDHNTAILFIYCLLKANHAPKKWQGITINRGQFVTGRSAMVKETGLSVQSVRTSINRLKSTSEVTIKSTNKFSILTICNWDIYQLDENESNQQTNHPANQQVTSKQPATNQQLTTNKNDKNIKNEENVKNNTPPTPKGGRCPYLEIQQEWNRLCQSSKLPRCQVLNDKRKRTLSKSWKQKFFRESWKTIFANFHNTKWRRDNPEHAGFDVMFQKDNLTGFLEVAKTRPSSLAPSTETIVMIRTGGKTKPRTFKDSATMNRYMTEHRLVLDKGMNLWMKEKGVSQPPPDDNAGSGGEDGGGEA